MIIYRKHFYDTIKSPEIALFPYLTQKKVEGFEAIFSAWENDKSLTDLRWLAYMLATTYHETARTMQPIEEYGKGKGMKYGHPDPVTNNIYYGRGFVQLTWKENYETMTKLLGFDLVNHPELALQVDIATQVMFEGMIKAESTIGDFTGKSLENYFSGQGKCDWINARRIINGKDKAEDIAGYAIHFMKALATI